MRHPEGFAPQAQAGLGGGVRPRRCSRPSSCSPAVLQEKAELYCESLRLNGLISTIEPADGGSDGTSSS
jgi:hypothetical protein